MNGYRVDVDRLAEIIEQIDRFGAALEQSIDDVAARVGALYPTWTAEASVAHQAAHERWHTGAVEVRDGLMRMRQIAATAHGNYLAAVEANQRMWAP